MAFFSGLAARFRNMLDPNRLAMSQSLLAGDDGAAAQMAQRFRQLQAEHERLRMWDRKKRNADAAFDSDGYASLDKSHKPKLGLGTRPSAVFGLAEGDAAPTGAFDDVPGDEEGIEGPDFAQTLRQVPHDMMFPVAAFSLPQERDAKLREKRPAPDARSAAFRGSGRLGVSAQARQPTLVDAITEPARQQTTNMARNLMPPGADGRIGQAYADPDYLPVEQSLEREYGLPAGILSAIRTRGERSNADQVSEAGARSVYQIIPETRRSFMRVHGVDAWAGPEQAARVAALHLRERYERHRDWNRAILEYHAGPNRRRWGPRTRAYGERVGDFNGRR